MKQFTPSRMHRQERFKITPSQCYLQLPIYLSILPSYLSLPSSSQEASNIKQPHDWAGQGSWQLDCTLLFALLIISLMLLKYWISISLLAMDFTSPCNNGSQTVSQDSLGCHGNQQGELQNLPNPPYLYIAQDCNPYGEPQPLVQQIKGAASRKSLGTTALRYRATPLRQTRLLLCFTLFYAME